MPVERISLTQELLGKIAPIGRSYAEPERERFVFDWTLSGCVFSFTGKVLIGRFAAQCADQTYDVPVSGATQSWLIWPRIAVFLDDAEEPDRIFTVDAPEKEELILSADDTETHRIRIVKLTEAMKSGASLCGFRGDGAIEAAEYPKRPVIEFIGDSITCGYGNAAPAATGYFIAEQQDPMRTYAYLTARALGREPAVIGFSGICAGMYYLKPLSMLDLYPYTDLIRELSDESSLDALYGEGACDKSRIRPRPWAFSEHPVEAVVINLGANDTAYIFASEDRAEKEAEFDRTYYALLSMIREHRGNDVSIICALGDMNHYLYENICRIVHKFRADTGADNIYLCKLCGHVRDDLRGAADHPGLLSHESMAADLTAFLKTILD